MLYLNGKEIVCDEDSEYNLTLTNVVFEFRWYRKYKILHSLFNFNKCCIWIGYIDELRSEWGI